MRGKRGQIRGGGGGGGGGREDRHPLYTSKL